MEFESATERLMQQLDDPSSGGEQRVHTLAAWRLALAVRLASARGELLWQCVGLDEEALTLRPTDSGSTCHELLAHVAAWDDLFTERMQLMIEGRAADIDLVDQDERNTALHQEFATWPLHRALRACLSSRAVYLAMLSQVSDEELHRVWAYGGGETSIRHGAIWRPRHDASHAAEIEQWKTTQRRDVSPTAPPAVLRAAFTAARHALILSLSLVPEDARMVPVSGSSWSVKDIVGHLADWDAFCTRSLQRIRSGRQPIFTNEADLDAWNERHHNLRHAQPWSRLWSDMLTNRAALDAVLDGVGDDDWTRPCATPWSRHATPYHWIRLWTEHDREHAADVRLIHREQGKV